MYKIQAQYTTEDGTTLDCTTHETMGEYMDREFETGFDAADAADELQDSVIDFGLHPTTEYFVTKI